MFNPSSADRLFFSFFFFQTVVGSRLNDGRGVVANSNSEGERGAGRESAVFRGSRRPQTPNIGSNRKRFQRGSTPLVKGMNSMWRENITNRTNSFANRDTSMPSTSSLDVL